jgi:hypothetical protein
MGLRGLTRRLDILHSRAMKRGGGGEDDEVHDEVREEHARVDVEARVGQLMGSRAATLGDRLLPSPFLLLHLLGRLPEKQVRRDGRAENAHEGAHGAPGPVKIGNDRGHEHGRPVWVRQEGRCDVGEEDGGEPLQGLGEGGVARVDGDDGDPHPEHHNEGQGGQPREHGGGFGHPAEVRGDVEDVGHEKDEAGPRDERTRVVLSHRPRQSPSRDEADPRAHELDGGHEGKRDHRRPQEEIAVSRSRDGVGGDAAGVVVGGARDEAGPEDPEVANDRVVRVIGRPLLVGHHE